MWMRIRFMFASLFAETKKIGVWIVIAISFPNALNAEVLQKQEGHVCWPLHFAGITLGVTNDSQIQRLLGKGVYRREEGDTGGRYFIDVKRQATLHVVMYTDSVVGELTVLNGIDPAISQNEQEEASSKFFSPGEGFGKWHALHLGSSKEEVLKNLGTPAKQTTKNEWVYFTTCACELPEFFTVFFKDDTLFKIIFSAPAG